MFGNTEVWVVVVEVAVGDIQIYVESTEAEAQAAARLMVIAQMESTVPEYDPDGCRQFVLDPSVILMNSDNGPDGLLVADLDDAAWLAELRNQTTEPWVTIQRHIVPINPVSQ